MISPEQYRAVREAAGRVNRSDRGRIQLIGEDRRAYLQGLLTNDIEALAAGSGCYACLLTAQGRMIADMYVIETGTAIVMDLEAAVAARVAEHLERFVFSEDVEVADVTRSVAQVGVLGPAAAAVVSQALGSRGSPAPASAEIAALGVLANRTWIWGDEPVIVVRRDDFGGQGFDVLVRAEQAAALEEAIGEAGAVAVDAEVAEVCRVENGRPVFGKDMTEDTIPLEAGIEDRAISLTKGCYVGQEIIIRVLHRGHGRVARRLVGLTLQPGAVVPARGAAIRSEDREIGSITSAVWSPALERPIAMGYVHRDFVEPATAVTVVIDGQRVPAVVTRLPFVGGSSR
jgi:folate-binding protein YgfZ